MKRSLKNICGNVSFKEAAFSAAISSVAEGLRSDPHHRLYSWDHSHEVWKGFVKHSVTADHATLHLAFYLASWGMYRGSSDLLFRDYKVLSPAIQFLKGQAPQQWEDCVFTGEDPTKLADRIVKLSTDLSNKLKSKLKRPDLKNHEPSPTDTLLSKILLNTLACVPAFDVEVKKALFDLLPNYTDGDAFRPLVLKACIELARHNRDLLEHGRKLLIEQARVTYPLTKVFDLYLWIYGNGLPPRNTKKKASKTA